MVKRAVGGNAADSVHPSRARELVRDGSRRAVERAGKGDGGLQPLRFEPPIRVGVEFGAGVEADFAAVVPGFERQGDRGVVYVAQDPEEAYRAFVSAVRMAGIVD